MSRSKGTRYCRLVKSDQNVLKQAHTVRDLGYCPPNSGRATSQNYCLSLETGEVIGSFDGCHIEDFKNCNGPCSRSDRLPLGVTCTD